MKANDFVMSPKFVMLPSELLRKLLQRVGRQTERGVRREQVATVGRIDARHFVTRGGCEREGRPACRHRERRVVDRDISARGPVADAIREVEECGGGGRTSRCKQRREEASAHAARAAASSRLAMRARQLRYGHEHGEASIPDKAIDAVHLDSSVSGNEISATVGGGCATFAEPAPGTSDPVRVAR